MNVIEARKLSRAFGSKEAVIDLDLTLAEGSIYAFLGPNGAGKTTTLKMLMNILEPTSGGSSVLGVDSRDLGPQEFAQIGYISENQRLPGWMSVQQLMDYCKPFYPTWDEAFAQRLLKQFDLPLQRPIKNLSRGMQMKAALLSSLAYRPRLLVMDEPFSGLDPLVRDELIRGVLELTEQENWTVMVSSHDIDEVERLADWVGLVNKGHLEFAEPMDSLQRRFRQIEAVLPASAELPTLLPPSWMAVERAGQLLKFVESDYAQERAEEKIRGLLPTVKSLTVNPMSLREIFLTLASTYRLAEEGGRP
jgi:ABC-2 type transport system ATP-binding protein